MTRAGHVATVWLGCLLAVGMAAAERLPVRRLTTADGLPHDQVHAILTDARGFLWFGTRDGLALYDGESFRSYGLQNGLASAAIESLLETRDGVLWVGTQEGVCRFRPTAASDQLFSCSTIGQIPVANDIHTLFEDRRGLLWVGTADGLFTIQRTSGAPLVTAVDLGIADPDHGLEVGALAEDSFGCTWAGTMQGLARLCPGRPVGHFEFQRPRYDNNRVFGLLVDRGGRLWVNTSYDGILVFKPGAPGWGIGSYLFDAARRGKDPTTAGQPFWLPERPGEALHITEADGLANGLARGGVWASSDGVIWFGTQGGLSRFDGQRVDRFGDLRDAISFVGAEDRAGNLWFGTAYSGALRLNVRGFVTYTADDGLSTINVRSVFPATNGAVTALTMPNVACPFDGHRFLCTTAAVPWADLGWGHHQLSFQDSEGDWWIGTGLGLMRFRGDPNSATFDGRQPKAIYNRKNGLSGIQIFRLYEDSRHDIWISTLDGPRLTRWERSTGAFHEYDRFSGFPFLVATAFAEDHAGGLWMGFYHGGLCRYAGGRFTFLPPGSGGVPTDWVSDLYCDHRGQLWAATHTGLIRIDDPGARRVQVRAFGAADGISSNVVTAVVEDRFGRVYVGTGRGVDRLDQRGGSIAHFSISDGLASTHILGALRDATDDLWFATSNGLSRLSPQLAPAGPPPPALLRSVRVDGRAEPVPQLGTTELSGLVLRPGEHRLEIGFVAIASEAGEAIRYQHRLRGIDGGWAATSGENRVVYDALPAGSYTFAVRALASDGQPGQAAALAFEVLPPWWRRSWVIALGLALLSGAVYMSHRLRVSHLLSIERVRSRLATDLHDDLGASLSRIALLSEVAAREIPADGGRSRSLVNEIGGLAREAFDSTADIVWAIDPRRDNLGSLVSRLSEYARDVLGASGATWALKTPHGLDAVPVAGEARRELFLLLKEAVHNAARHSRARQVTLDVDLDPSRLRVEVCDDGQGFAPAEDDRLGAGDGLDNMRTRAASLGGTCRIVSSPGSGASVQLEVPVSGTGSIRMPSAAGLRGVTRSL